MGVDRGGDEEQWNESKKEEEGGGLGEGPEEPVGCVEEAVGDGEEHHGAPSVQPGEQQCTKAQGHQGHQAAGALPLPARLYHHLQPALTKFTKTATRGRSSGVEAPHAFAASLPLTRRLRGETAERRFNALRSPLRKTGDSSNL